MSKILLVEPAYMNKYPPLGLMKISTYHKSKGDKVDFYKGKAPYTVISKVDRVYITTLFTFYYDITIDTIAHYLKYTDSNNVYVGGIAAALLYDHFAKDTGLKNIINGQLTSSSMVGYTDNVNIDELPLDYDILDDVLYRYPAGDNFFVYATRGCPRKCDFCAVSVLEPNFKETNNIIRQIRQIREKYGDKRNVLLMDNNILYSSNLEQISNDLVSLGFEKNNPNFIYPNPLELLIGKIERRKNAGNSVTRQEEQIIEYLSGFANRVKGQSALSLYKIILDEINNCDNKYDVIISRKDDLIKIIDKYRYRKPLQRYVDFNQGVDVRLLSEEKMQYLKDIPISPFRLAYDDINISSYYYDAFGIAYKYGVRHFSNYILYNYKDSPEDLWTRLHNNVILYEGKSDIQAFSFPMKYTPIERTDREFVGHKWNKKFLSAVNVIINVTNGVVAKEKDFFYKAYGRNISEFMKILVMPNEFIKHRFFFEEKGYIEAWEAHYTNLNSNEKECLLSILCGIPVSQENTTEKVLKIKHFYKITKNMASKTADYNHFLLENNSEGLSNKEEIKPLTPFQIERQYRLTKQFIVD